MAKNWKNPSTAPVDKGRPERPSASNLDAKTHPRNTGNSGGAPYMKPTILTGPKVEDTPSNRGN
jgi:hypothetical protein